jgi:hypothetical protein
MSALCAISALWGILRMSKERSSFELPLPTDPLTHLSDTQHIPSSTWPHLFVAANALIGRPEVALWGQAHPRNVGRRPSP